MSFRPVVLTVPSVEVAAAAIQAVAALAPASESPEPYRAAAYALGWEDLDGSDWWAEVMDFIG